MLQVRYVSGANGLRGEGQRVNGNPRIKERTSTAGYPHNESLGILLRLSGIQLAQPIEALMLGAPSYLGLLVTGPSWLARTSPKVPGRTEPQILQSATARKLLQGVSPTRQRSLDARRPV